MGENTPGYVSIVPLKSELDIKVYTGKQSPYSEFVNADDDMQSIVQDKDFFLIDNEETPIFKGKRFFLTRFTSYVIKNVPEKYPITVYNNRDDYSIICYGDFSKTVKSMINGKEYDFYYGTVTIRANGDFDKAELVSCYGHDDMTPTDMLIYEGGDTYAKILSRNIQITSGHLNIRPNKVIPYRNMVKISSFELESLFRGSGWRNMYPLGWEIISYYQGQFVMANPYNSMFISNPYFGLLNKTKNGRCFIALVNEKDKPGAAIMYQYLNILKGPQKFLLKITCASSMQLGLAEPSLKITINDTTIFKKNLPGMTEWKDYYVFFSTKDSDCLKLMIENEDLLENRDKTKCACIDSLSITRVDENLTISESVIVADYLTGWTNTYAPTMKDYQPSHVVVGGESAVGVDEVLPPGVTKEEIEKSMDDPITVEEVQEIQEEDGYNPFLEDDNPNYQPSTTGTTTMAPIVPSKPVTFYDFVQIRCFEPTVQRDVDMAMYVLSTFIKKMPVSHMILVYADSLPGSVFGNANYDSKVITLNKANTNIPIKFHLDGEEFSSQFACINSRNFTYFWNWYWTCMGISN